MEMAVATVLRALGLGINLIDTSPSGYYAGGQSESWVGLALLEWYRRGGRREDLVLSTKVGARGYPDRPKDYSAEAVRRSVALSLEALHTDYLDVVLVHDPDDLAPVLAAGGALEALQAFKRQGVVRATGLGARPHDFHRRCIERADFDMVMTYRDYNLINQSALDGVLRPAARRNVGVWNATVTLGGLLGGLRPLDVARAREGEALLAHGPYVLAGEEVQRAQAMWDWAQSHGVDPLALNLQYCLRQPAIASTIVGAASPAEIEADVAAVTEPIPEATWQAFVTEFALPDQQAGRLA
jgi:D-threo-aldose 1-dehydrogenase